MQRRVGGEEKRRVTEWERQEVAPSESDRLDAARQAEAERLAREEAVG